MAKHWKKWWNGEIEQHCGKTLETSLKWKEKLIVLTMGRLSKTGGKTVKKTLGRLEWRGKWCRVKLWKSNEKNGFDVDRWKAMEKLRDYAEEVESNNGKTMAKLRLRWDQYRVDVQTENHRISEWNRLYSVTVGTGLSFGSSQNLRFKFTHRAKQHVFL